MKHLLTFSARVLFLSTLLLFGVTLLASAAPLGQIRLGYPGGDDWEPALAVDAFGQVYVLWPHYGGVPGCAACPSPTVLLQVSPDRGQTWSTPRVVTPNSLGT
jgi:hypothetical protein